MKTSWVITFDLIDNGRAVMVSGPHDAPLGAAATMNHPDRVKFRMRDADGELYYGGVLVGDNEFAPLDDFGGPNAGCTSIEIRNGRGEWEEL